MKKILILSMLFFTGCIVKPGRVCLGVAMVNNIPVAYAIDLQYKYCSMAIQNPFYEWSRTPGIAMSTRTILDLENTEENFSKVTSEYERLSKEVQRLKIETRIIHQRE
ncbi:MAG: hypothetical protein E6R13_05920 [Spirochaetes bacterium]|nr:MAG: hypothetical protein E6R13_05920 [Spirochaetota bacterium]